MGVSLNALLQVCAGLPFLPIACFDIADEDYSFLSETNRYKRFLKLKIESKTFVKQAHLDSYLSIKKRSR